LSQDNASSITTNPKLQRTNIGNWDISLGRRYQYLARIRDAVIINLAWAIW